MRAALEERRLESARLKKNLQERLQDALDMEMMGGEGDAAGTAAEASAEEAEEAPAAEAAEEGDNGEDNAAGVCKQEVADPPEPAAEEPEELSDAEATKKKRCERFGMPYVSPREAAKKAAAKTGGKKGAKGSNVCFAFEKGKCKRGDACRFCHTEDTSGSAGGSGGQKRKGLTEEEQKKVAARGARFGTANKSDEVSKEWQEWQARGGTGWCLGMQG